VLIDSFPFSSVIFRVEEVVFPFHTTVFYAAGGLRFFGVGGFPFRLRYLGSRAKWSLRFTRQFGSLQVEKVLFFGGRSSCPFSLRLHS
jgi:hypothetical protein